MIECPWLRILGLYDQTRSELEPGVETSAVALLMWMREGMQQQPGQSAVIREQCSTCGVAVRMAYDGRLAIEKSIIGGDSSCGYNFADLSSLVEAKGSIGG